jgi:hypothetical protein
MALFSWLSSWFTNLDRPPCAAIYVLRVPADNSPPHILLLQTIDNSAADNVDCCFDHIPDLRSCWGSGEAWQRRGVTQSTITHQHPNINGVYLAWRSFAIHLLPVNPNAARLRGMLFIAQVGGPRAPEWPYCV